MQSLGRSHFILFYFIRSGRYWAQPLSIACTLLSSPSSFSSSFQHPTNPSPPPPHRQCIYTLPSHTSTIRSLRTLHNRPIAISGSRDTTLRVWDVQRGRLLRVLEGHQGSVRCLDVCGGRVVSGSYDATCRVSLELFFRTLKVDEIG